MIVYTLEHCWEILRHYFENHDNVAECVRKLRTETGIPIDKPKREKPKTVRTPENIGAVTESVCEAPSTSIHRRSQQSNISETSLRRILHNDLGITPYKVQVQDLKPIDHTLRFRFAKWACDQLTEDEVFGKKIIFSDEAHFDLGSYINKKNCRMWGTENPHADIESKERPLRYRAMLNKFLYTKIEKEDIGNIWFQQAGAMCHTAEATLGILRPVFVDRIISHRADVV